MGEANLRRLAPVESDDGAFVMEVSERSLARVRTALLTFRGAQAAANAATAVAQQAQATFQEAVASLADAAGQDMPADFRLEMDEKASTITVTPVQAGQAPAGQTEPPGVSRRALAQAARRSGRAQPKAEDMAAGVAADGPTV